MFYLSFLEVFLVSNEHFSLESLEGEKILEIRNVAKNFGPVQALKFMNLDVYRGRVHTLLGENGAGKSTLMKILSGLFPASDGQILFKGKSYNPQTPLQARNSGITTIFQELSLSRNLTVAENIFANNEPSCFGFINEKMLYHKAKALVEDLELPIDVHSRVNDLSMAKRQLVEIAKALSHPADLVIMDEPTSSLSDNEAEILFKIIDRLKQEGKAVIYISHRMNEIMRVSDDISVMRDGEYITTVSRDKTEISELIALMVGRSMDNIYPPRIGLAPDATVPPLLEVKNLNSALFHDVTFDVRPGEVLGFFGLIGAGRSDVMRALFGIDKKNGQILINGKEQTISSPTEAIKHGIAFLTENRKEEGLVLSQSVLKNINMVSLSQSCNKLGFMHYYLECQKAEEKIKTLGIKTASMETSAGNLSGGNQQKIVLAKWLEINPRILILDEPTRGVDVGAKFEMYKIIRELAASGAAILLISSELPEILGLSDRVVVMYQKRIETILPVQGLDQETVMKYAAGVSNV